MQNLKEPVKTAPIDLANKRTVKEVDAYVTQMKLIVAWCDEHPQGGSVCSLSGHVIELDARDVQRRRQYALDIIERDAPAWKRRLAAEAQSRAEARRVYPSLFKRGSQEWKIAWRFFRQNPEIKRMPNRWLVIGDAICGMKMRLAGHE